MEIIYIMNESVNFTRYKIGQKNGHYESFFQRANHPDEPKAFWIRYTIFSPKNNSGNAIAESWAIFFDGKEKKHIAVKNEIPLGKCIFANSRFNVKVGDSILRHGFLSGNVKSGENSVGWNLNYSGNSQPLFVLSKNLYQKKFPKAKLLVGLPLAEYNGNLIVNGKEIEIKNWIGSQNHNWGVKHTDHYAWGQVAGFDNFPESFLEVATARLKFWRVWTPFFTLLVLRHKGREFRLNTILQSLRAYGRFKYFAWDFNSTDENISISGTIFSEPDDFVGLKYYNPPGGIKHCLNTKIASCKLIVKWKNENGKITEDILQTNNRAAFEILTDDKKHNILIRI